MVGWRGAGKGEFRCDDTFALPPCSLLPRLQVQQTCDPVESWRRGSILLEPLRARPQVRGTGHHRWSVLSACTLVLSVVPGNRICVTRKAVLGFHDAIAVDRHGRQYSASEATRVIAETYPAPVRAWIVRHGGLSPRVLLLRSREP